MFLTGATGFLGRRLLAGLLQDEQRVTVLVRAPDHDAASRRMADVMPAASPDPGLRICLGALDRPGLGLSDPDREHIVDQCGTFLHCGASVRFDLPLEAARAVNVAGTAGVIDLARQRAARHGLQRLDYVSTAYVAGDRTDVVLEGDLDPGVTHRNTYERSKFEAEQVLREAAGELPIAVFRPSIVVPARGDWSTSPIGWAARVYASGLWRTCPGRPETPVDLVTDEFVAGAILRLRSIPETLAGTFHLTAGVEGTVTLEDAAAIVQRLVGGRKAVRFVEPVRWMRYVHPILRRVPGVTGRIARKGEYYVPYFLGNPRFDNRGARHWLAAAGVSIPGSREVLERLLACALTSGTAQESGAGAGGD